MLEDARCATSEVTLCLHQQSGDTFIRMMPSEMFIDGLHKKKLRRRRDWAWIDPHMSAERGKPCRITVHGTALIQHSETWAKDDELRKTTACLIKKQWNCVCCMARKMPIRELMTEPDCRKNEKESWKRGASTATHSWNNFGMWSITSS